MAAADHFARNGVGCRNWIQRFRLGTLSDDEAAAVLANIPILTLNIFRRIDCCGCGSGSPTPGCKHAHNDCEASYGSHKKAPSPQNSVD
jgi:hypothetical protein